MNKRLKGIIGGLFTGLVLAGLVGNFMAANIIRKLSFNLALQIAVCTVVCVVCSPVAYNIISEKE